MPWFPPKVPFTLGISDANKEWVECPLLAMTANAIAIANAQCEWALNTLVYTFSLQTTPTTRLYDGMETPFPHGQNY